MMFNEAQRISLLNLARDSICTKLASKRVTIPQDEVFELKRGLFVTLHKHGNLRGCIGYIFPYQNIVDSVQRLACAAAFRDPRFPPVSLAEMDDIVIEISLLSELIPVETDSDIQIGRDGLYIEYDEYSGILLPQVALEYGWDKYTFLRHLCLKAGLPELAWKDAKAKIQRFSAQIFSEA